MKVYGRAAAVCVISPGFRAHLLATGVPAEKVRVISNWVDETSYRPERRDPVVADALGLTGRFNVMFAGNLGEAQGLECVLDAAEKLRDLPDVQFVLVGEGTASIRLRESVRRRQLSNVQFLGRHPASEMPALYALSDVLLIHLRDEPLFRITIPHKTFAYMASNRPVLAAIAGDAAAVVQRAGAGLVCEPEDPDALADTVRAFRRMSPAERSRMAENGLEAIRSEYTRDRLVRRLEAVLLEAAGVEANRHPPVARDE
jgi:glycosyltransferase involved in cell wall biosynthesis